MLGGSADTSLTKRLAGTIFIIRVASAALAYLAQILLARWMGGSDYGIYVYVWTWVLLLGSMMDFGISASAQKIIPEYRAGGEHALLRGFLSPQFFERGLICRSDDRGDPVVQISPPLIAGQAEFDEMTGIIGDVLTEASQRI